MSKRTEYMMQVFISLCFMGFYYVAFSSGSYWAVPIMIFAQVLVLRGNSKL